jgi:hypothetical protein
MDPGQNDQLAPWGAPRGDIADFLFALSGSRGRSNSGGRRGQGPRVLQGTAAERAGEPRG